MKPTDILTSEHRIIEQVLNCLEKMVQRCNTEGKLDQQAVRQAIDFFRTFADRCHHGKEETHLFPAMEAKGFPRDAGPIGVMLYEHDQGRGHLRGMDAELPGAAAGDDQALQRLLRHARSYLTLLREHIRKEDGVLFPMANQVLSPQEQADLMTAFQKVETEEMGSDTHQTYLRIADQLAERFGVSRAVVEGAQHTGRCGCGH